MYNNTDVIDYFVMLDAKGTGISINKENSPFEMSLPKFYDDKKYKKYEKIILYMLWKDWFLVLSASLIFGSFFL